MRAVDLLRLAGGALARAPGRTALMMLATAIGVAAVIVLTSLGEGARRYVTGEFASLGTNLLIVVPGRSETTGGLPALIVGQTPRDLTLDDALALVRSRHVARVAPVVVGSAPAQAGRLEREIPVLGSTHELLAVRRWQMASGRFLPPGDARSGGSVCVIGEKVRRELYGDQRALGQWLRLGDRRFRVVGVLGSEGRSIGVDVQEVAIVPVVSAQAMFNTPSLFRILVEASSRQSMPAAKDFVLQTLTRRHQGERDVTVIAQDAVLATFDRIFSALTLTLGGIAAISLAVAGVLIMNVMLVAVTQRTAEIGLLKAIGASGRQVQSLFLAEATMLSLAGALAGLAIGLFGARAIRELYPALPVAAPPWAIAAALGVALVSGLVFGILPARRAARLDPVHALAGR